MANTPTAEEERAIAALDKAAEIWPDTLWLFSADGNLFVMRKNAEGERGVHSGAAHGGMDHDYIVTTIDIENDGGDW